MKKNVLKYMLIAAIIVLFGACKEEEVYIDNDIVDVSTLDSIGLIANHTMIVADGKAQIELTPVAYTKYSPYAKDRIKIYGPRIKEEWFDFVSETPGVKLSKIFSIDDPNLIGQELKVKIRLKNRPDVEESQEVTFKVIAPIEVTKSYTIPIVFHIVQTKEDIDSYGGIYVQERIDQIIDRLNNIFQGKASEHPTGVNTKITFKPVIVDPNGIKLKEAGINRLTVKEIPYDVIEDFIDKDDIDKDENVTETIKKGGYTNFLTNNHLIWPSSQYLNVWLISDRVNAGKVFCNRYSYPCKPKYQIAGAEGMPEGLTVSEIGNDSVDYKDPYSAGLFYRLQTLNQMVRYTGSVESPEDNDLVHYIGSYFGLLQTSCFEGIKDKYLGDYCEDTQKYCVIKDNYNVSLMKDGKEFAPLYFMGENIMDDPTGVHRSVTQQQYQRIQWVLENCPDRAAWRSDFGFTGAK